MNIPTRVSKLSLRSLLLAIAISLGSASHTGFADILVNLDATQLPAGPLATWVNSGTIASNFTSAGAQVPVVENIAGVNAVQFIGTGGGGGGTSYIGPVPPPSVTGTNGRTVEAWIWDPAAQGEKTIFGWGRRGADNINCSFNHGTDAAFGAVGHWGGGPDIGWAGQIAFTNWTHIVYTYDPYTFVKSVYKDGQLANRETNSLNGNNGPPFLALNTASINDIGTAPLRFRVARQNNANGTPSGTGVGSNYIARIRVHDVPLDSTKVRANYYRELCAFAPIGISCADDDGDGFPNWYEALFPGCLDPAVANAPGNDCDGDGATDMEEYINRSLVNNPDTDGDGIFDGAEIHRAAGATDPTNPDSDGDA
jgi:concanavalin A-like lectin/glucanase superfamily protein